nr:zinc finger, CCHC-type [Tanacetum cinerariifolium]
MAEEDALLAFQHGENATMEQIRKRNKWDNDDHVCRGLILNGVTQAHDSDKPKGNNVDGPSVVNMMEHNNSFRFYVIEPNELISINSIIESKDAIFDKNKFSSVPRPSQRFLINRTEGIGGSVILEEDDPKTFDEVMKSQDVAFWKEAMTRISTIRLLIGMASIYNLIIHQMYVKITFLNDELDEEVYMNQPQGFIMPDNESKVDLIKEFLSSKFSMKDIGAANVILDIRIKHESNGIVEMDTQEKEKNKAKNDKTKHEMEKIKKDKVIRSQKVKSQSPRSTKVNPRKVKVNIEKVKVKPGKADAEKKQRKYNLRD